MRIRKRVYNEKSCKSWRSVTAQSFIQAAGSPADDQGERHKAGELVHVRAEYEQSLQGGNEEDRLGARHVSIWKGLDRRGKARTDDAASFLAKLDSKSIEAMGQAPFECKAMQIDGSCRGQAETYPPD